MSSTDGKNKNVVTFSRVLIVVVLLAVTVFSFSCIKGKIGHKQEQNHLLETPLPDFSESPESELLVNLLMGGTLTDIQFEELEWASLTVKYWLFNPDRSYSPGRVITISDKETIKKLNRSFATESETAVWYATDPRLRLTLPNGQQWDMDMSHPNRISCSQTDNNKNACVVALKDTRFYEELREICFEHEKTITPNVVIDNIVLCNGGLGHDIMEIKKPYSPMENQ